MTFVDTNYFIRFLLKDVPAQYSKARKLFEKGLRGNISLFSSVIVFFELCWVFSSFYKKSKDEVIQILLDVMKMSFIDFENRDLLEASLLLFQDTSLELEDCYNLVYAKSIGVSEFASFDRKAKREFSLKK
jgi:predicted nucleic acid-binding protein